MTGFTGMIVVPKFIVPQALDRDRGKLKFPF